MEPDGQLLLDYARDRSQTAFDELVRRHVDLVYSAALRQVGGDAHAAQDVSQAVFLDLANQAGRLSSHPSLRGWLYTATHFAASKYVRSERRRRAREEEAHVMQTIDADRPIDWERLRPVLDEVMHELPERDRHAILLRWFDQRSTTEIGASLGLSESAARRLTDRALERLRELLVSRGVTSTAAALGAVLGAQTVSAAPVGMAGALSGTVAAQAASSTSTSPLLLTLMKTTKLQIAVLTVTAGLNLTLIRLAWAEPADSREEPDPRAAAPASLGPFVPPATPLVGDFTDPAFVGRKLLAEGYSERVIRSAVGSAVRFKHEPEITAIRQRYGAVYRERPRWKPGGGQPVPPDAQEPLRVANQKVTDEINRVLDSLLGTRTPPAQPR